MPAVHDVSRPEGMGRESSDTCPTCAATLATTRGATPWCPACEWRLELFEPHRRPAELAWPWLDRALFGVAYRLALGRYRELRDQPLRYSRWTASRVAVTALAVLAFTGWAALLGLGGRLVLANAVLPGAVLLLLAAGLRPRLGRLPTGVPLLDRAAAPRLFDLLDRVASAAGTRAPHRVAILPSVNAFSGTVGWRRRRVIGLGLPLWAGLLPQERVALVAHELGHFRHGDQRRLLIAQPAYRTFSELAVLTRPSAGAVYGFTEAVVRPAQHLVSGAFQTAHRMVVMLGQRDAQRAEYLADEVAARVAGTPAAISTLDAYLSGEPLLLAAARAGGDPAAWLARAGQSRAAADPQLPALRQLSIRDEVSVFAGHPPTGLRIRRLQRLPRRPAAVLLSVRDSRRIDAELSTVYARMGRDLAAA